jgi:hypothetical protein
MTAFFLARTHTLPESGQSPIASRTNIMSIGGGTMLRNRNLIAMLNGFHDRGIRTTIAAALLVACGLLPLQTRATLLPSSDGTTVYDTVNSISWLGDANLAASNRFGLPVCNASSTQTCINASGSMSYQAAKAWVAGMNAANYLGHANWQLPTTPIADSGCGFTGPQNNSFGFDCSAGALGSLYYNALGLKAPDTAVPIPNNTAGPFSNFLPYLYWSHTVVTDTGSGYGTFSFNTGFHGSNTKPNFLYVLPMIPGKIPGTPPATGNGLEVNPGGQTVYDPAMNVTWLANANVAATNTFGLPPCKNQGSPKICVNQDGAMNWDSADQLVTNMNTYNGTGYLGRTNWQLPPMDSSCDVTYICASTGDPFGKLFYDQMGLSPGAPVVATPDIAVGAFKHVQPYLYWSCQGATIQDACQADGPAAGFEWSFSFGNGFLGTDVLKNEFYVMAYYPGSPAVTVVEYYNKVLDHYFMTSLAAEIALLDAHVPPFQDWTRTQQSFQAYPVQVTPALGPVCRFLIPPQHGDSHFFSAAPPDCTFLLKAAADPANNPNFSGYFEETAAAFFVSLPDTTGACPSGTVPVFRMWNQRFDSNHRYTTSRAIVAQMLARGYVQEGALPNLAVMCAAM